nr:MAG TPA: hypothetical protein [Caudoviricetes sp.]
MIINICEYYYYQHSFVGETSGLNANHICAIYKYTS